MKMKERNSQLKNALGSIATKEVVAEVQSIKKEDTVNRQGHAAYSLSDELRLVTLLNTLKIQPQFYRSESEQMAEVRELVERIGMKDPYFLAQAIVWSRHLGEGMRSVSHLAAVLAAPFISGNEYAKRFYGTFNKKTMSGGCVHRMDDMSEMKDVWAALKSVNVNGKMRMPSLPNAMKKGFASVIENADTYQLAKYKNTIIDMSNLVHPNSSKSKASIVVDGKEISALDALMNGITVSADTWEVANSEAGQEVAKAVKAGKLTKEQAKEVLAEAKNDNWEALLRDGRLGVLAALRNIRNMMKSPRAEVIDLWCKLITNKDAVLNAKILPCHFDLAYDVVRSEFANVDLSPKVQQALMDGYSNAIPNLKEALPGKTCVIVDCSGSMSSYGVSDGSKSPQYFGWSQNSNTDSCAYKAGLIAATIAKATRADVVKFGSRANFIDVNYNTNVFTLAATLGTADYGGTNPATAFDLLRNYHKAYDRIIFISDNEVNGRLVSSAYKAYIHDVCSPYIYSVDLAGYGTAAISNESKLTYLFGYGSQLYDKIASSEFNPNKYMDEIRKIVI